MQKILSMPIAQKTYFNMIKSVIPGNVMPVFLTAQLDTTRSPIYVVTNMTQFKLTNLETYLKLEEYMSPASLMTSRALNI